MATILLTGDVMLGRGIDQIFASRCEPRLFEPFLTSALTYIALAEARSGPIPRRVSCDYVWGDALAALGQADATIFNLETALTCCDEPAPKGINYRCHPANVPCLTAAGVDCCSLANNHVLDWGEEGLMETLDALESVDILHVGAGRDLAEAQSPATLPLPGSQRLLVHALASETSGVPFGWAAKPGHAGVNLLEDRDAAVGSLADAIEGAKRQGDIAMVSIHWGDNWGHEIPDADRRFAHRLIDEASVDIVHGHSSHHPKAIEFYRGKPILYGCGDFLNDYEGISGHESYRSDLVLAYRITTSGDEFDLTLLPFRVAQFRLNHASDEEVDWLTATLGQHCRRFGTQIAQGELGRLLVTPL